MARRPAHIYRECRPKRAPGGRGGQAISRRRAHNRPKTFWADVTFHNRINGYGGPGGHIKIIDFVGFFVVQNQKSFRMVPSGSAVDLVLSNFTGICAP